MHRLALRLFGLCWLLLTPARGEAGGCQDPLPIGSLVMARHAGVHFRIQSQDAGEMYAGLIERVQQKQGAWLWLGQGWVQRCDIVPAWEAVDFFTAEIKRKPTAFAYIARISAAARQEAFATEIESETDKALKLDPEFAAAHLARASTLLAAANLDAAIDACDDALLFDPRLAEAFNVRGGAWFAKGRLDKAVKDFDRAIRLAPRLSTAHANRSQLFLARHDYERALAAARESLKHDPAEAKTYLPIGQCWLAKGDDDRAMAAYNEAIRLDPKYGEARLERGKIHLRRGEYYKAMSDLNQAVQLLPKDADALEARSFIYSRLNAHEKSRADHIAAARIRKPSSSTQTQTSASVGKTNSTESSPPGNETWAAFLKRTFETKNEPTNGSVVKTNTATPPAAETKPNPAQELNSSARRKATSADERYLDGPMAVEQATEACEKTDWKRADYVDTLAAAYAETGDFEAAINWQLKAIDMAAANSSFKAVAEERLELYRAGKPCREDSRGHLARELSAESKSR